MISYHIPLALPLHRRKLCGQRPSLARRRQRMPRGRCPSTTWHCSESYPRLCATPAWGTSRDARILQLDQKCMEKWESGRFYSLMQQSCANPFQTWRPPDSEVDSLGEAADLLALGPFRPSFICGIQFWHSILDQSEICRKKAPNSNSGPEKRYTSSHFHDKTITFSGISFKKLASHFGHKIKTLWNF